MALFVMKRKCGGRAVDPHTGPVLYFFSIRQHRCDGNGVEWTERGTEQLHPHVTFGSSAELVAGKGVTRRQPDIPSQALISHCTLERVTQGSLRDNAERLTRTAKRVAGIGQAQFRPGLPSQGQAHSSVRLFQPWPSCFSRDVIPELSNSTCLLYTSPSPRDS